MFSMSSQRHGETRVLEEYSEGSPLRYVLTICAQAASDLGLFLSMPTRRVLRLPPIPLY